MVVVGCVGGGVVLGDGGCEWWWWVMMVLCAWVDGHGWVGVI